MSTTSPTPHPVHPSRLEGSAWSRVDNTLEHRHWQAHTFMKKSGMIVLRAVLEASVEVTIPWRELRDRQLWEPGWSKCERADPPPVDASERQDSPDEPSQQEPCDPQNV